LRAVKVTSAACKFGPNAEAPNPDRQPRSRPSLAFPAAQPVGAMLDQDHADRRQLRDLMAAKPTARPTLIL
jgi:hypothetical protein